MVSAIPQSSCGHRSPSKPATPLGQQLRLLNIGVSPAQILGNIQFDESQQLSWIVATVKNSDDVILPRAGTRLALESIPAGAACSTTTPSGLLVAHGIAAVSTSDQFLASGPLSPPSWLTGRLPGSDSACPSRYFTLTVECTNDIDSPGLARSLFQAVGSSFPASNSPHVRLAMINMNPQKRDFIRTTVSGGTVPTFLIQALRSPWLKYSNTLLPFRYLMKTPISRRLQIFKCLHMSAANLRGPFAWNPMAFAASYR